MKTKFRIWDEENKEFEYIDFNELFNGYQKPAFMNFDWVGFMHRNRGKFEFYIGLEDKNEREIFQNDIYEHKDSGSIYIVKWIKEYCGFIFENIISEGDELFFEEIVIKHYKYIGNIHEKIK